MVNLIQALYQCKGSTLLAINNENWVLWMDRAATESLVGRAASHENRGRLYTMLNVIFVLRCSGHSGRVTEIVHITECAHIRQRAADVNCFDFGLASPPWFKILFRVSYSVLQDYLKGKKCPKVSELKLQMQFFWSPVISELKDYDTKSSKHGGNNVITRDSYKLAGCIL